MAGHRNRDLISSAGAGNGPHSPRTPQPAGKFAIAHGCAARYSLKRSPDHLLKFRAVEQDRQRERIVRTLNELDSPSERPPALKL